MPSNWALRWTRNHFVALNTAIKVSSFGQRALGESWDPFALPRVCHFLRYSKWKALFFNRIRFRQKALRHYQIVTAQGGLPTRSRPAEGSRGGPPPSSRELESLQPPFPAAPLLAASAPDRVPGQLPFINRFLGCSWIAPLRAKRFRSQAAKLLAIASELRSGMAGVVGNLQAEPEGSRGPAPRLELRGEFRRDAPPTIEDAQEFVRRNPELLRGLGGFGFRQPPFAHHRTRMFRVAHRFHFGPASVAAFQDCPRGPCRGPHRSQSERRSASSR